jgi:transcriptional regulator with XRE-family HTH domain
LHKKDGDLLDIRTHRKRAGITQARLARRLNVTQSAVCLWEKGKNEPCKKYHKRIAQILGVTVEELTGGNKDEEKTVS